MEVLVNRSNAKWVSINPARGRSLGRLFCFPFAGGGAAAYYPWSKHLPPDIELVRILLPGRESRLREPLVTRIGPLVAVLVDELTPWLDRPFAVYGHSIGALVAFEFSRELRRRHGLVPAHLFVSAYRAPHLPPIESPFAHLPDEEFIDRISQYGGIPELVAKSQELMDIFLPILRADFEISETYVYREEFPLECPITAFGGVSDPKIDRHRITAWKMHTSMRFNVHFFEGGHFFIQDSKDVVLDQMSYYLTQSLLIR